MLDVSEEKGVDGVGSRSCRVGRRRRGVYTVPHVEGSNRRVGSGVSSGEQVGVYAVVLS